ncbi:MAG: OB-fold domain-containing protein [Bryobacteraceae bacterium]
MGNGTKNPEHGTSASEAVVYTETVVFAPPEQYAADAPYQLAIVDLPSGERRTVRILGKTQSERVSIGDAVTLVNEEDGVRFYRKSTVPAGEQTAEIPRPLV